MCDRNEHSTAQDSSNEEASHHQEPVNEQNNDSDMELLRTDSIVEDNFQSGNQTPQYDAFLQSLSNRISSYLSEQTQFKPPGDSQKAIISRPDKPSRSGRKPPKRMKRTKS